MVVRVDAGTALVLREAYYKLQALPRGNHYALYDYVRGVTAKVAPVDTFFVGFLQGADRVRYPYGYEDGKYDDPSSHTFGPSGPTAWLLNKRQTYRFGYDNGATLNAGIPCGDVSRRSEDAVIVPMFRRTKDGRDQLFGMMATYSYQSEVYDDNAVRAFEWLAGALAKVLTREVEDQEALRLLPAGDDASNLLTSDHVMEYLSNRIAVLRGLADRALDEPGAVDEPLHGYLKGIVRTAEQTQSELIEMMLEVDEGPERRFLSLTDAQQRVALLLVQGLDNEALATELGVRLPTVKTHLGVILRKYGMESRIQVAQDVRRYLSR
ncbi:LuxR C-terminal-related transcriptional regulator [Kribbella sp. NPDC051952]|uniref:helix-turn-helix transcriptional regulator n=1 Tax=Kribbella sp. NPDC051952 TaxID=3154851 RepID=UPI0034266399